MQKSNNLKSQYNQDYIIDKLLKNKRRGYFIDIGAHDGISLSNSYFFEIEREYKGVCFEANPEVYMKLAKNRLCTCINAAVSDKETTVTFVQCTGYAEMLSGIKEFRDQRHIQRTIDTVKKHGGEITEIQIQSVILNKYLEKNNIKDIDFLSIDIEGGEYEVLKTIDFSKIDIKILAIEINYPEIEEKIITLLNKWGYMMIYKTGSDGIFTSSKIWNYNIFYWLKLVCLLNYVKLKRLFR